VLLLSEGVIVYQGPPEGVVEHFAGVGYVCDAFNNPADFMFDVLSGVGGAARRAPSPEPPAGLLTDVLPGTGDVESAPAAGSGAHRVLHRAYLLSAQARLADASVAAALAKAPGEPDVQVGGGGGGGGTHFGQRPGCGSGWGRGRSSAWWRAATCWACGGCR
jgi:hypothetical protein